MTTGQIALILTAIPLLTGVIAGVFATGGLWYLLGFRLKRLETVTFGADGNSGMVREIEEIKITCAGRHGDRGAQGPQGIQGLVGPIGLTGPRGAPGTTE